MALHVINLQKKKLFHVYLQITREPCDINELPFPYDVFCEFILILIPPPWNGVIRKPVGKASQSVTGQNYISEPIIDLWISAQA